MKEVTKFLPLIIFSILIFAVSSIPGSDIPSQVTPFSLAFHFALYLLYSFTILLALKDPLRSYAFGVFYAFTDEIHQLFVPGRSCDPMDFLVDSLGLAVGITIAILWKRLFRDSPS